MACRERDDDYKFLQIVDAMASINQKVNLIGVVLETTIPRKSKGTDYFCTLKIADESRPNHGFTVNFFAETMEKLPNVELAGDIIQLSQVVIKACGTEVNAVFNKFSSFALFEGKHGTNFNPYQLSSKFHAREQDKKFITDLRKWLADRKLDTGPNDSLSLKEIREGEQLTFVCKILHRCEVERMLFVWDGTDTPSVTIQTKLGDQIENPLPLQLEKNSLSRDILSTFPAVGTILRVNVDQNTEKLGLHLLKTNRWVTLIKMKCEIHMGFWRGILMPYTKLQYLPDDDDMVLRSQMAHDERILSKWGRMPFLCFPWPSHITDTDYPDVPFVTLMNVLTYPEVTAKFKCVARVVAACPWRAEDFRSPQGTYRIRLTLEDPSARIHAFLYAEDGVEFFGGYPSVDILRKKRNMLLGVGESDEDHPRNPPWVQSCLKSYYIDKSNIWGSRNFRIFATRMVG